MPSITIEKITIPYKKEELLNWKARNPETVPQYALNWNGPGISNGYGFGEWKAEQYFRKQGYYIINNEFNLLSNHSKFKRYNQVIKTMVHESGMALLVNAAQNLNTLNYNVENPDLFVFNLLNTFFVEVKKEKDILREPQINFMFLANLLLKTESKLVYMSDSDKCIKSEFITENVFLPNEIIELTTNIKI